MVVIKLTASRFGGYFPIQKVESPVLMQVHGKVVEQLVNASY